jgi:EAL domain-containing protein (putative c-di-GMP-specific phosphodiesterase class I)
VDAKQLIEKLVSRLNKPHSIGGQSHIITVSIGATLFNGEELDVNQIIGQADFAMFEVKKNGRNDYKFFDNNMRDTVTIQGSARSDFSIGIEREEFRLFYQVQVDNNDNVFGAEALVRWMHPERSLLLPDKFIRLLDEPCLGEWILNAACSQLNRWEKNSLTRDLTLSVNISAKQFHQVNFVEQVKATVRKHCINPRLLILEFKESALVDNIEFVIASMNILKEFGIKFDLNNFGIGYSSLHYLTKLPLDHIKIDLSFVRNLTTNNEDGIIVQTITAMADSLGVNVIAEGVETEAQKQILKNNGCQRYQGFLFGKPEPIAEFERVLFKAS